MADEHAADGETGKEGDIEVEIRVSGAPTGIAIEIRERETLDPDYGLFRARSIINRYAIDPDAVEPPETDKVVAHTVGFLESIQRGAVEDVDPFDTEALATASVVSDPAEGAFDPRVEPTIADELAKRVGAFGDGDSEEDADE